MYNIPLEEHVKNPYFKTKLLQEVLSRGGQQKALLLRTVISGSRANRGQLVALIYKHTLHCYKQAVGSKITERYCDPLRSVFMLPNTSKGSLFARPFRLCREECTVLEEFSHYMKKQHATDYSRQTLNLLERIMME